MVWRLPNPQYGNEGFCLVGSHAALFIETLQMLLRDSEITARSNELQRVMPWHRELTTGGMSHEAAEERVKQLMWQRLAAGVPEPLLAQTGCSYDRLPNLQKWQLLTYVAHFLLTEEGPTPELTMLREAAVFHVYCAVSRYTVTESEIEGLVQATLKEYRFENPKQRWGFDVEDEEEVEEEQQQQQGGEAEEGKDSHEQWWEKEDMRKQKLADRLYDMTDSKVFWDRDWEMEYLYAGQPKNAFFGTDIAPTYYQHEPSLSEAAARFPTFADCKNHIDFLAGRVHKDMCTLAAEEPLNDAAVQGEAQASGETTEAGAAAQPNVGMSLRMERLMRGLGAYDVLTREGLKTLQDNMAARIRRAALRA